MCPMDKFHHNFLEKKVFHYNNSSIRLLFQDGKIGNLFNYHIKCITASFSLFFISAVVYRLEQLITHHRSSRSAEYVCQPYHSLKAPKPCNEIDGENQSRLRDKIYKHFQIVAQQNYMLYCNES